MNQLKIRRSITLISLLAVACLLIVILLWPQQPDLPDESTDNSPDVSSAVQEALTATPTASPTSSLQPLNPTITPTVLNNSSGSNDSDSSSADSDSSSADSNSDDQAETSTEAIETNKEMEEMLTITLNAIEETIVSERDLYELAITFGKIPDNTPRIISEAEPAYQLGDIVEFTVSNFITEEDFQVEATLQAQTAHASWWVSNNVKANKEGLDASAKVFEEQSYATNRVIFGSEWTPGIDGDPRVHIFLGEVPGVGGYYSSADEFPRSVNPNSNQKEMFYLNFNNAQPGSSYFDGVLSHEFQHMIHWHIDRNEETWLNEGLSELATKLNGFNVGGSVQAFASTPDIPVTHWSDQTHPFYGSAFLLVNYFYQRFGEAAISELVQTEADGVRGIEEVLAIYSEPTQQLTFNQFFADWTVANLLDDSTLEDGRYGYTDDIAISPAIAATVQSYPYHASNDVYQYGTDYIRFTPTLESLGTLTLDFSGDTTVPLLPTEAHSGNWMLWSNRGDDSYSQSSHAFDLSNLESATLKFWTWYDIEIDYDYAYVALSTDNGQHWKILPATDSIESNPHGNSFGAAFTGKSGQVFDTSQENPARWQEQSVDLTPFVGQQVLISFQMINDDALNYNGFVVDDISIPELNYLETFEEGVGEWQNEGFVRVDNLLPQQFIVQAVAEAALPAETTILPFALDKNNQGSLAIEGFGDTVKSVTLIVNGAMPFTAEKTKYSYSAKVE